ncbi:nucleotidyltransferase domain-containing protein [Phaeobacter sp. S60]|uniref:nucleotidyltransferase domain-containing protein n=1 Tax=Phaeobacter sp. S60 TaxID=1569353 RepID=UPI000598F55D|nr:nucleotidyltransferase domain-containing protein [Phaeobacter sp. S60]KII18037.1 hypothetical protein OO25_03410 [Phaeobacter sp. S60]
MAPRYPSLSKQGYALVSKFSACLADHDMSRLLHRLELHVFGSIARGASLPSDFDVAIVYKASDYSAAKILRTWVRENSDGIKGAIGLDANLLVLSEAEFLESRGQIGPTLSLAV